MKRLFGSVDEVGQGAVYRAIGFGNGCIGSFVVDTLPKPTCEIFPSTVNNLGSFPYHYGDRAQIDNADFIEQFSDLDNVAYDRDYPNMWDKLDPGLQSDILLYADQCFCKGEGIEVLQLVTGKPKFPGVDPIPWFYIPTAVSAPPFSVRPKNPDGEPLPATCCPDGEVETIDAEIVNGVLQLTRHARPEKDYVSRQADTHESFQRQAGYPRWCCLPDPNEPGKFTMRWLHFPRWPRKDTNDANPDGGGAKKEPLGIIPVVVDIGCTDAGELKIYWANLVFHDGMLTDVQWDTAPPRPGPAAGDDYTVPPDDPETLAVNQNYQGAPLLVDGFDTPIAPDGKGNTCTAAAGVLGLAPCDPTCPSDIDICPSGGTSSEHTGVGPTADDAVDAAFGAAEVAMPPECDEGIYLCAVVELPDNTYEATTKFCC